MSDENQPQNQDSENNPTPPSPQEPTEQGTENTAHSEPPEALPEALVGSPSDFSVKSNDIPPSDSTHIEPQKEPENQAENESAPEPVSEPMEAPQPETAQMGRNEPLGESSRTQNQTSQNPVREILAKAQQAIQNKKRKKLDSILTLFAKRTSVTNDEVEKFLHVSDATATRYLSILEKEGKIKQSGKTGRSVSYSKI